MRHNVAGRHLGRNPSHRRAMWRNQAVSLFTHGQITTTIPKAKAVKPFVEKIISIAREDSVTARRRVTQMLGRDHIMIRDEDDENVERNRYGEIRKEGGRRLAPKIVKHIFEEVAPTYRDRPGGYTRIIKLARHRIGDGADLCVLQLVSDEDSGPQVSGRYSRRRDKANKRMDFAAKLRKGGQERTEAPEGSDKAGEEPEAAVAEQLVEEAQADQEASVGEAPAEQSQAHEASTEQAGEDTGEGDTEKKD
ncbi:MAG: 50S ribosomal protein L17 [Phycisphaeraceae bacterium]